MDMSDYLANALINLIFRNTGGFTTPSTLYYALVTQMPEQDSTGSTIVEPVGGSYARVALNPSTTNYTAPADKITFNNAVVTFPAPTGNWGTIVGVCICNAVSAGNLLFFTQLIPAVTLTNGSPAPSFGLGNLNVRIDN